MKDPIIIVEDTDKITILIHSPDNDTNSEGDSYDD